MIYFHSSDLHPKIGAVFQGRGAAYEQKWESAPFYSPLERYRPSDKIGHKDGVFVCNDLESIALCGGLEETILLLKVDGELSWHDMNWSTEISSLLSSVVTSDSDKVRRAAEAYWAGMPHENESVWEGIARSATVVAVFDFDEDDHVLERERERLIKKFSEPGCSFSP